MQINSRRNRISLLITASLVILGFGAFILPAAQEDQSKDILPAEASVKTNPKRAHRQHPIVLRAAKSFVPRPAPSGSEYAQMGITLWRIDSGHSKGIEEVGVEQTEERLDTNASYTDGDTIRLNVISPTGGYLYIVDQEQYSDKSFGPATLVFPTTTLREGNNLIQAWESVQIPRQPAVWRFRPRTLNPGETHKPQIAEVLTMIISPKPLVDASRITAKQLVLKNGEFEGWQAQWKGKSQQFDMKNTAGQTVPAGTKGVDQVGAEEPNEEELDAQTTYQVAVKPGAPIMVTVPLTFNSAAPPIKPPT